MQTVKPIGGYFEWEFPPQKEFTLHQNAIFLNSGRHALEYILCGLKNIAHIYIPYYTCDVVVQPLERLHIPYSFYHINKELEIADEISLKANEYLIYTNYFGIKDAYVKQVAKKYGDKVIIDNAQAFYCPAYATHQIYSPRKYSGMPDGGLAVTSVEDFSDSLPQATSFDRCIHLLKRTELMPSEGYKDFKENSHKIAGSPVCKMGEISRRILTSVDWDEVKERRIKNFKQLHKELASTNKLGDLLSLSLIDSCSCPMVYPYWTDDKKLKYNLIKEQIFVATYWPNVLEWTTPDMLENEFANNLLAIPCDQRYGEKEMNRIVNILLKYRHEN